MRTGLFLLAGFLLAAATLILGKLFSETYSNARAAAIVTFIVVWLVLAVLNMWAGVAKAGYSVGEELPIFALIFAVPVVAAVLVNWKVL